MCAGTGFAVYDGDELDEHHTVFQAELVAIIHTAHTLLIYTGKRIKISDNQSVVKILSGQEFTPKLVVECVELLNTVGD